MKASQRNTLVVVNGLVITWNDYLQMVDRGDYTPLTQEFQPLTPPDKKEQKNKSQIIHDNKRAAKLVIVNGNVMTWEDYIEMRNSCF